MASARGWLLTGEAWLRSVEPHGEDDVVEQIHVEVWQIARSVGHDQAAMQIARVRKAGRPTICYN
ncbi:hypothetical protein EBBID32_37830 [Sphingobium indicum BiD32]|uniref:Uncharacterized protein n=1 Tax=Sphingobium indicum BiD32 TaxID=1301087 RepID=N1MUW1_9SPHN|nr:hypothetical protein EBBID32_37830 [Sphingobium indicum BiD32]